MSGNTGTPSKWSKVIPGGQHPLQHGLGFLLSGSIAFVVDVGGLKLLQIYFGVHPLLARLVSLSCAHVAGWLSHRRFTFRLTTPPTWAEFMRYAGVQSTITLVINYGTYWLILQLLRPETEPVLAAIASSGVAMFFSYFGIRFGAFRQHRRSPHE
jgi:putative flippase GtrA